MLTIPAGYYSLHELAEALQRQGVAVVASPSCSDDLYALRAPGVEWEDLRKALLADERLTIERDGRTWRMALSGPNEGAEKAALARLVEAVRSGLQEVYGPTARRAAALWDLSEAEGTERLEEDQRALGRLSGREREVAAARLGLLAGALTDKNDWNYQALGLPAALTQPGSRLGKVFAATLLDAGRILVPSGNMRKYLAGVPNTATQAEAASFLQRRILVGKVVWDPLTLATGMRSALWAPELASTLDMADFGEAVRALTHLDLSSPQTEAERVAMERWRQSPLDFPGEVDVPNRAMAASEALLRWADASGTGLVAYVSPLGDLPLMARSRRSLASVVRDVDAGTVDAAALRVAVREWTGLDKPRLLLPAERRLSVSKVGAFAVVRTETRYLDARARGSVRLPSAWARVRMEGRSLPLAEIVRVAARFHPGNEEGGVAPLGALAFCNPASFYPVANLLKGDPALLAEIAALGDKGALTRPLPHPEALAMDACGANDAATDGCMDPMVWTYFAGKGAGPLELDVRREGDRLAFEIVAPQRSGEGRRNALWSTWARI